MYAFSPLSPPLVFCFASDHQYGDCCSDCPGGPGSGDGNCFCDALCTQVKQSCWAGRGEAGRGETGRIESNRIDDKRTQI